MLTGQSATTDPGRPGLSLDAFIDMDLLPRTEPERFERFVSNVPGARDGAFLIGRLDYQQPVACRDADPLNQTVRAVRHNAGAAGS